ncbi:VOC family protein [Ectothiorhodospiraceae bacterium 2226]|nr:VOC family protein [Ectothiorhodospiraceae bacterium 2226]
MLKFIRFAELPVTDQDRAVRFYTTKVGLEVEQNVPYQDGWRWIELCIPGAQTGLLFTPRPNDDDWDVPSLIISVDDVHATYRALHGKGVQFTQPPLAAPWNPREVFAHFRDSEGNIIEIVARARLSRRARTFARRWVAEYA